MKNVAAALLAAQRDAPAIPKEQTNSQFGGKSKYVSLDTLLEKIVPVLNKHDLVLTQHPAIIDGQPALTTQIIHAGSGETMTSTMLLLVSKTDPQGQGSAITYARRYALMAALGLSADEDDDGNRASQPPRASRKAVDPPAEGLDPNLKRQLQLAYRGLESLVGKKVADDMTLGFLMEHDAADFGALTDAQAKIVYAKLEETRLQQAEAIPR